MNSTFLLGPEALLAPQPLDQTDLDEQLLLILKSGGGRIHEVASD
jgi:hypothetical protein